MTKILRQERVPLPVVKEILESMMHIIGDNPVAAKAYEHVKMFSKCSADEAREAVAKLREIGFSETAAVMLVNLLPESLEEAKALLGDLDGGYEEDKIERALEVLSGCRGG